MKTRTCFSTVLWVSMTLAAGAALAQSKDEAAAACLEAAKMIESDDIDGALEEARWCVEGLEQLKQQQTVAILPDEINGYTGQEIENQSVLGMTVIEREYTGEKGTITVSLSTGGAGSGLAALAQMGMSMGAAAGKKMRIQKRTVIDLSEEAGDSQFLVQLKSGGMLNIGSRGLSNEETLDFVKAFPIEQIDDALAN